MFDTDSVLTLTTGTIMTETKTGADVFGDALEVLSFLIGRTASNHEIGLYKEQITAVMRLQYPDIPLVAMEENWREVLADGLQRFGDQIKLDDDLAGTINAFDTPIDGLRAMGAKHEQIMKFEV